MALPDSESTGATERLREAADRVLANDGSRGKFDRHAVAEARSDLEAALAALQEEPEGYPLDASDCEMTIANRSGNPGPLTPEEGTAHIAAYLRWMLETLDAERLWSKDARTTIRAYLEDQIEMALASTEGDG